VCNNSLFGVIIRRLCHFLRILRIRTITETFINVHAGWYWAGRRGQVMVNKVAGSFQVDRRLQCLINCTLSPICDSYNYRPSDKTCQLNTHDTPLNANSTDIVYDSAWTWWSPDFCTVV